MAKEHISKFRDLPKLKTTWWAMGLGLGTPIIFPALGIFAAVLRPFLDSVSGDAIGASAGFVMIFLVLLLLLSALTLGIISFRRGERSWVLWLGFAPAIVIGVFAIIFILGEVLIPH